MLISTLYITLTVSQSATKKSTIVTYNDFFFIKKVLFTMQPFGQAQHTINFSIIRIMWLIIKLHLWELGCNRMGEIIMKDVDSNLGPQNLLSGSLLERMISYHDQATCRSH